MMELSKKSGMLGAIFRKAQNRIQDPAKPKRLTTGIFHAQGVKAIAFRNWCRPKARTQVAFSSSGSPQTGPRLWGESKSHLSWLSRSLRIFRKCSNVLFFGHRVASEKPWTKKLWIYDFRTNEHFTLKTSSLRRENLDNFVACYHAENRHKRKETERFHVFDYDDQVNRSLRLR
jgi:hypothetical protein